MKITDVSLTEPCYLELPHRADAGKTSSGYRAYSFVRVTTDDGLEGFCPAPPSMENRMYVLEIFGPQVIGEDPFEVEKIWNKIYWANLGSCRRGAPMRALSCIDVAIWDVIGKACNQPVHRLLGGYRNIVPAYASGVNLNLSTDELVEQNREFVERGFGMVKMKIGLKDTSEDLRRIKAVRDAIGDGVDLAVDANNAYGVSTAIKMAKKMERFDVYWFEEPVLLDDVEGIARLAGSTSIPIAGYETENTKYAFKELIARGAIGICQADATICGGITEFRKIAALAECFGIPMAPHGAEQLHVALTAAIPNGLIVEHMPETGSKSAVLLKDPILPEKGEMACKDVPGLGIEVDGTAFEKYGKKPEVMGRTKVTPPHRWPPYS